MEKRAVWSLPANLVKIHSAEEACRAEAITLIAQDADLQEHLAFIEGAMDALIFFSARRSNDDEDEETIQLLGLRLFNDCAAALKLLLSGYAQASAMALRDILETGFLVAYLAEERSRISVWRKADDRTRKNLFKPVAVRDALDKRDGFKDGNRAAHYAVLCKMASHPSFQGFQLLAPEGQGCQGGPFTDCRIFGGVLDEMAIVLCAAMPPLVAFFPLRNKIEGLAKLAAMNTSARWLGRHGDTPVSAAELAETAIHVARLPDEDPAGDPAGLE